MILPVDYHGSKLITRAILGEAKQHKMVRLLDVVDYRRHKGLNQPDAFTASRPSDSEPDADRRGKPEC